MRTRIPALTLLVLILVIGPGLSGCSRGNNSSLAGLVAFDALVADPQRYADQYVCTEGTRVDGFEASGLGASLSTKNGTLRLTEPVIWLESADLQTREDCIRTDTVPPFEFCHVVVCGVFETGGGYGHGGTYPYQLTGGDLSAASSPKVPSGYSPPLYESTGNLQQAGQRADRGNACLMAVKHAW